MTNEQKKNITNNSYIDVIHEDPEKCAKIIQDLLEENNITNVTISINEEIGEIIPRHIIISVNKKPIVGIYEPIACHNYNVVEYEDKDAKIATIDTILSFYLAFYYIDRPYYDHKRILCTAEYLFDVKQKHYIKSSGILKRFSTLCYGKQKSLDDIRLEKYTNYEKLKNNKKDKDYEAWFLNYTPKPIEKMISSVEDSNIGTTGSEKKIDRDILPSDITSEKNDSYKKKHHKREHNKSRKIIHKTNKFKKHLRHKTHKHHRQVNHLPFTLYR